MSLAGCMLLGCVVTTITLRLSTRLAPQTPPETTYHTVSEMEQLVIYHGQATTVLRLTAINNKEITLQVARGNELNLISTYQLTPKERVLIPPLWVTVYLENGQAIIGVEYQRTDKP
ncbi:MAG: hypothetical protein AAF125_02680 [Chloroflexota bacterium]